MNWGKRSDSNLRIQFLILFRDRLSSENRTDLLRRYIPQNPSIMLLAFVIAIMITLSSKKAELHNKL